MLEISNNCLTRPLLTALLRKKPMLHRVCLLLAALAISISSVILPLERQIPGFVQIAETLGKPTTARPPRVLSPYWKKIPEIQRLRADTHFLNEQYHEAKLSGGSFNEDRLRQSHAALKGIVRSVRGNVGDKIALQESLLGRFTAETKAGGVIERQRRSDLHHLKTLHSALQDLLEHPLKLTVKPLDGNN